MPRKIMEGESFTLQDIADGAEQELPEPHPEPPDKGQTHPYGPITKLVKLLHPHEGGE